MSPHGQRADLDRQVARFTEWAAGNGLPLEEVVVQVGSGMKGKRRKVAGLLAGPAARTIVVEHRDRLARFGGEHRDAALPAQGRPVLMADDGEVDDLVRGLTEGLTSFCVRLYGRRGTRNRAVRALGCARRDAGPAIVSQPGGRVHNCSGFSTY